MVAFGSKSRCRSVRLSIGMTYPVTGHVDARSRHENRFEGFETGVRGNAVRPRRTVYEAAHHRFTGGGLSVRCPRGGRTEDGARRRSRCGPHPGRSVSMATDTRRRLPSILPPSGFYYPVEKHGSPDPESHRTFLLLIIRFTVSYTGAGSRPTPNRVRPVM